MNRLETIATGARQQSFDADYISKEATKKTKILLAHCIHSPGTDRWYHDIADSVGEGLDVQCFCVTLNPPGERLSWPELDRLWKEKDETLMAMYRRLQQAAEGCDVLLLYNGINIHPEFLPSLPTFNVYCCFDDPESSVNMSAPVASNFDAVFYGNIASRFQYENWGCKRIAYLPVFNAPSDVPPKEAGPELLSKYRNIDILFIGERVSGWRNRRLSMLAKHFPQAKCFGKGWEAGTISNESLHQMYSNAKIGWNIHNSTGPINRRLFALAAFGVLQICDNKTGLGQIFELGREVVGFDTIPEAIEATEYYLSHEEEGREIASNAYQRFWKDYHAGAIWERIRNQLIEWGVGQNNITPHETVELSQKSSKTEEQEKKDTKKAPSKAPIEPRQRHDERVYLGEKVSVYIENPEQRGVNMAKERLATGKPLDWPNMLALNWAVTSLIGKAKMIVDIGSGTGPFAKYAAVDGSRSIYCFEEDDFARNKAIELRSSPNVKYFKKMDEDIISQEFDLLVSVDVIEHVKDLPEFFRLCCRLASRAIFTTPNRESHRGPQHIGPPPYAVHVREFDPGEFYWVLKQYYKEVYLYHMPDVFVPWLEPMTTASKGTPIIAECLKPLNQN